jgi:hypothetical protein
MRGQQASRDAFAVHFIEQGLTGGIDEIYPALAIAQQLRVDAEPTSVPATTFAALAARSSDGCDSDPPRTVAVPIPLGGVPSARDFLDHMPNEGAAGFEADALAVHFIEQRSAGRIDEIYLAEVEDSLPGGDRWSGGGPASTELGNPGSGEAAFEDETELPRVIANRDLQHARRR